MNFSDLIKQRRSIRNYDPDKRITEEELQEIIAEANEAPSWKNFQASRYHYVLAGEKMEQLRTEGLPSFNAKNSAGAAALIVTTFLKDHSGFVEGKPANNLGNAWGAYDLGLHNAYFILSAAARGWGTLIMGLRHEANIRAILDIPENEELAAVIALGWPLQKASRPTRKAVQEISTSHK